MGTDAASIVALATVGLIWFIVLAVNRWAKYGDLPPERKRRLSDLRARLNAVGGPSLTIPDTAAGDVSATYGSQLRSLFTANPDVDERTTEPLRALARQWRDRLGPLPRLAAVVAVEAVVLGVLAGIVLVDAAAVSATTGLELPLPSFSDLAMLATAVFDIIVGWFPATNLVWALVLTGMIMLYEALYAHGLALAVVLAVGAATLTHLDRRTKDSIDLRLYPRRRATAMHVLRRSALIWITGVSFATTGQLAGAPDAGGLLGAGVAFCLAAYYTVGAVRSLARRLTNEYEALTNFALPSPIQGRDYQRERIVGYLAGRKLVAGAGILAAPLLPVYLYEALTHSLWAKLNALAASGPLVQAALLLIGTSIVLVLAQIDPGEWRRLSLALERSLARNAIRSWLVARGLPVLAVAAAVAIGLGFQLGPLMIIAGALAVGLAVRGLARVWQHATHRIRQTEVDMTTPNVDVMVDHIDTPDGLVWVARVHTHWLAWPDDQELRTQIERDIEAIFEDGQPEESLPARYYEELKEAGRTDPREVAEAVRLEAKRDLETAVKTGSARVEDVNDRLHDRYPDGVVASVLDESRAVGRVSRGDSRYYWHGDA